MNAFTPGVAKGYTHMACRKIMQPHGKMVLSQGWMIRQKLESSLEINWVSCTVGRSLVEFCSTGEGMQRRTRRITKAGL